MPLKKQPLHAISVYDFDTMKRLRYISRAASHLSQADIQDIARISKRNNQSWGLTGFLVYFEGIFFQILEGEEEAVDALYFGKILKDPRHNDIICLGVEALESESQFRDWSMKLIDLSGQEEIISSVLQEVLLTLFKSQSVLSQYTQPSVLNLLQAGIDPTTIAPKRVNRIIMFADIANFTTLTELFPPEAVIKMVNQFIDICTLRVREQGGEMTKIMGDKIMACFDEHTAERAIEACMRILNDLVNARKEEPEGSVSRFLYIGIGLAQGWVVEGNIGSSTKKDYTLMGDTVNFAARLESMTRVLERPIVFSESIAKQVKSFPVEALGSRQIKGKQEIAPLYSIENCQTFSYEEIKATINDLGTPEN